MSVFTGRPWSTAPSELWAVCWPNASMTNSIHLFATKRAAVDYAKKQAQTNDGQFKVYRLSLEGVAAPTESRFIEDPKP